ncbi:hypothetical protein ACNS7O_04790 [Haloferacaceae archaeon DSL9]
MAVTQSLHDAHAQLTVSVSRHAPGDLAAGVERQLRRVDGVAGVDDLSLGRLRPGLNALTVDVRARLRIESVDGDSEAAVAAQLSSGFGVDCHAVEIERRSVPPD